MFSLLDVELNVLFTNIITYSFRLDEKFLKELFTTESLRKIINLSTVFSSKGSEILWKRIMF